MVVSQELAQFSSQLANCLSALLTTTNGKSSLVCSLCQVGFVLVDSACVSCLAGCEVCNPRDVGQCVACLPGYFLNDVTLTCSNCTQNCVQCSSLGCLGCEVGYWLDQSFQCLLNCEFPCATCSP